MGKTTANKHGGSRRVKLTQYLSRRISLYKVKIRGPKKLGSKTPLRLGDFPWASAARFRDVGLYNHHDNPSGNVYVQVDFTVYLTNNLNMETIHL